MKSLKELFKENTEWKDWYPIWLSIMKLAKESIEEIKEECDQWQCKTEIPKPAEGMMNKYYTRQEMLKKMGEWNPKECIHDEAERMIKQFVWGDDW